MASVKSYCDMYVIRHGQTDWNLQGYLQGHVDTPLNADGVKQAEKLKETLRGKVFSAVFSSDLVRASSTAKIVSEGLPIQETPALRERTMGRWETHKRIDLAAFVKEKGSPYYKLPKEKLLAFKPDNDIDSFDEVYSRFAEFVKSSVISQNLGKTVLLSSHGGVLKSILYKIDFRQDLFWSVPNCAFLRLHAFEDGTIQLVDMRGPQTVEDAILP
jgi:broad specificity phosphatase PhoE